MPAVLTLTINGETQSVPSKNVRELLAYLSIREERVAVELNHHIVRRAEWDSTALSDRDKVEIVQFVGGG